MKNPPSYMVSDCVRSKRLLTRRIVPAALSASASRVSATSSIPFNATSDTRSVGSWLRSVPFARQMQAKPDACSALASDPPPLAIRRGS